MSDLLSRCKLFNALALVQTLGEAYAVIQGMETEDAEYVVRCKDCKHWRNFVLSPIQDGVFKSGKLWNYCHKHNEMMTENDFCSRGERKDGDDNG